MVPGDFHVFFVAAAGVSGGLTGLLFVAISVSPEHLIGLCASPMNQVRASTALVALITPLTLSGIALIPGTDLGVTSTLLGLIGLLFSASALTRLLRGDIPARQRARSIVALCGFVLIVGVNVVYGVSVWVHLAVSSDMAGLAVGAVASLILGIDRARELLGGRRRARSRRSSRSLTSRPRRTRTAASTTAVKPTLDREPHSRVIVES